MVVELPSEDNLRYTIYSILKQQGLLDDSKVEFSSSDSDNLKDCLSKIVIKEETPKSEPIN